MANLLIQSNIIRDACDTTSGLTVRYIGSIVGLSQTCETIALENEVQLANLSAYVSATVVGGGLGVAGLTWGSVSDIICDLIKKIFKAGTYVCSATGRATGMAMKSIGELFRTRIDQVSIELANRRVEEYPTSDETVDAIKAPETKENKEAINEVITKGIIRMLVEDSEDKPFTLADLNNVITKFQEAYDPEEPTARSEIASIGYGIFARLVKAATKGDGALESPENIVEALQANTRFKDHFYECTKYPAGVNPKRLPDTKPRSRASASAMAPAGAVQGSMPTRRAQPQLGAPVSSSQPQRPALTLQQAEAFYKITKVRQLDNKRTKCTKKHNV